MSETTTNSSTDQGAGNKPTLTRDFIHSYRGIYEDGAFCRLRIFEADDRPPVVVLSEMAENPGTSITNMIEHLAPEIVRNYLPHRAHEQTPAIFLESYDAILNARRRRSGPSVSRVYFSNHRPTIVNLGGVDRLSWGDPVEWTHLDEPMLAALIGDGVSLDD